MKVRVRYSDGNYDLVPVTDESVPGWTHVTEDFWARYQAHVKDCQFWHSILGLLDDATFEGRRREAEDR